MKKEIAKRLTETDKQKLRRKWKWEFMKRSKEYIEDFEDLRKKDLTKYWKITDKYGAFGPLPDPNGPFDAERSGTFEIYFGADIGLSIPLGRDILTFWIHNEDDTSILKNSVNEIKIGELCPPIDYLEKKGESLKFHPGGDLDFESIRAEGLTYGDTHWCIHSLSKGFEKLNEDNCPYSFTLNIRVDPALQKENVKNKVLDVFNELWDIIAEAQKSLQKGTFLKPFKPRWDVYDKYVQVYDLKKANPNMEWSEIAKIVIPEEVEKHGAPHRKTRKTELPSKTTIDKIRHYWREANKMINKEGWKKI
jgi:hypothetical protein